MTWRRRRGSLAEGLCAKKPVGSDLGAEVGDAVRYVVRHGRVLCGSRLA